MNTNTKSNKFLVVGPMKTEKKKKNTPLFCSNQTGPYYLIEQFHKSTLSHAT